MLAKDVDVSWFTEACSYAVSANDESVSNLQLSNLLQIFEGTRTTISQIGATGTGSNLAQSTASNVTTVDHVCWLAKKQSYTSITSTNAHDARGEIGWS